MNVVNEYVFFLDSKYRNKGANATPTFSLDSPLILSDPNNWFQCQVLSVDVPFSFKSLASPNNKLYCRLVVPEDSVNYYGQITIPEGNYPINTLLDQLGFQLQTFMSTAGFPSTKFPSFEFSYDKTTGRATLGLVNGSGSHTFTLTLYWSLSDIFAEYFGFEYLNNTILSYTSSGVITSTNFVSPNHVNTSPITSLFLRSSSLNQISNNTEKLVEKDMTVSDILCKIPINSYYNTWILYENNYLSVRLNNKEIVDISFYITSNTYDAILFDGIHYKVVLKITEIESPFTRENRQRIAQQTHDMMQLQSQKENLMLELQKLKEELNGKIAEP
jgi:hypothetical protein